MNKASILLVGAGGHALSCIDVIEQHGHFEIIGLIGTPNERGQFRLGYPVLGCDDDLETWRHRVSNALVCIGQIRPNMDRQRAYVQLMDYGFQRPVICSPHAHVSKHACLGPGTVVMHGAIVNAGAEIGQNCIINSNALVEHGVRISDHCHISTSAVINGDVCIGAHTTIGSSAVIREGITIGSHALIGMGSVIRDDVPNGELAFSTGLRYTS